MAAAPHRRDRNPVAEREPGHAASHADHLAGELMAEHGAAADAERYGIFGDMQVGSADPAGRDPKQHFVLGRLRPSQIVDTQRLADPVKNGGFHLTSSNSVRLVGNQGASTTLQIRPQMPPRANSAMARVRRPSTTR